jgi:hypothetical protein
MSKKKKIFGVTKSGKAKPIKALTGLEIALISGALTAGASALMLLKLKELLALILLKKLPILTHKNLYQMLLTLLKQLMNHLTR